MVDGQLLHFGARGLYNAGLLTGDRETGSYWQHLSGTCVHGPLRGKRLATFPLLHMTAGQAAHAYPSARLALSRLSLAQRIVRRGQEKTLQLLGGRLPPGFQRTMGDTDARLPLMERGLAVWTDRARRFYPLGTLRARGNALIDARPLAGGAENMHLLVYLNPRSDTPTCVYTEATACNWHGDTLVLRDGTTIREAVLYGADDAPRPVERPQQSLTCWYSYAYTFPGGEIYEGAQ